MADSDLVRVTGMWRNSTRQGDPYYSGTCGPLRFVMFTNNRAKSDRDPEWTLYLCQAKKKEDAPAPEQSQPEPETPTDLPF